MTSRCSTTRPALAPLLSAIVAASLPGCGGSVTENRLEDKDAPQLVPTTPVDLQPPGTGGVGTGSTTSSTGGTTTEMLALHCVKGTMASLVHGIRPVTDVDSFAHYVAEDHWESRPPLRVVEQAGEACAHVAYPEHCLEQLEEVLATAPTLLRQNGVFEVGHHHLFVATGRDVVYLGGPAGAAGTGPTDDDVLPLSGAPEMLEFLGAIDTPNEAALVMWLHGYRVGCELYQEGNDYVGYSTVRVSECPLTDQEFEVRVGLDGNLSAKEHGKPVVGGSTCTGRRPDGLREQSCGKPCDAVGTWLAEVAHLELASVGAFLILERELAELGAPAELLRRLRIAASDEVRHAVTMNGLAQERGAAPVELKLAPRHHRTAFEIALENAVEGCVRETWGALCAHYQAATAGEVDVRRAFAHIAWEETAHAELSRDVEERESIERAKLGAAEELRRALDRDVDAELVAAVGLPDRKRACELFAGLTTRVLAA